MSRHAPETQALVHQLARSAIYSHRVSMAFTNPTSASSKMEQSREVTSTSSSPTTVLDFNLMHSWRILKGEKVLTGPEVILLQRMSAQRISSPCTYTLVSSVDKLLPTACLGDRYLFHSAFQAVMHRVAHHHFSLSGANNEDTIVLGIAISKEMYADCGASAVNGYCHSLRFQPLDIDNSSVKLMSVIRIAPSLK
eukprot:847842-Amphidinium_carterae.1